MNIAITALVLFGVFAILLILGCPISVSIAISSIATTLVNLPWDQTSFIVMQKMNSGVESFSLLAVPLFILAGNIMNNGGIARRLIRFAQLLSGRIPGSLAHTNVLANMFFGALSGSAVAAASAIGGIMAPMEEEEGYDPAFSTCEYCIGPDRASDSANQRIYRILHSCRRRICLSPVHGGLYSRHINGPEHHGDCILLCEET